MMFDVGFSCLVALAVTAGITSLPEQQLKQEDQIAVLDERQIYRESDCATKRLCKVAGGTCQSREDECDGELRVEPYYCKQEGCGCCIPPGCVFGGKSYPDGSVITIGCIRLYCNKGNLTSDLSECRAACRSDDTRQSCGSEIPCSCAFELGKGCTLGAPNIPRHACRCKLIGPVISNSSICIGTVVDCADPASPFCKTPGIAFGNCRQGAGVNGTLGNCKGY